MNIEILKKRAEEFKEPHKLLIEKTKEYDLAFIESKEGHLFSEKDLNGLKHNLGRIADLYQEMRLIDEFVEYCDFRSSEKTESPR